MLRNPEPSRRRQYALMPAGPAVSFRPPSAQRAFLSRKAALLAISLAALLLAAATWLSLRSKPAPWPATHGVRLEYDLINSKVDMADELAAVTRRLDGVSQKDIQRLSPTRLAIWIPYPQALQQAEAALDAALREFQQSQLTPSRLEPLLSLPPESRAAQINRLAPEGTVLRQPLLNLASAFDSQIRQKHAATATSGPATQAALRLASSAYENALSDFLAHTLEVAQLRQLLRAADDPADASARARRDQLVLLYPAQATEILHVIDAHQRWRAAGGATLIGPEDVDRLLSPGALDFRIAAQVNGEDFRRAVESLHLHGPAIPLSTSGGSVKWFEIARAAPDDFDAADLTIASWHGATYVLCSDDRAHTLTHDDPQRTPWRVHAQKPRADAGIIMPFELDPAGAALLRDFSQAHLQRTLIILLDNQALAAPLIREPMGAAGLITFAKPSASQPVDQILRQAQTTCDLLNRDPLPSPLRRAPAAN